MRLLKTAAMALLIAGTALTASAQATRTWVSGVGDDANPCSRTAPCKTFAGAISKTAAGGEISVLDPGGFGQVTITKSITIDGTGQLSSILASGVTGIIVNAAATDRVYIRNIEINGAGTALNGMRILTANSVTVEGCAIYNIGTATTNHGIDIALDADNTGPVTVNVINTTMRNIKGMGIKAVGTATAEARVKLDNVQMFDGGQSGLDLNNFAKATVSRSMFSGHVGAAIFAERASTEANVFDSVLSYNGTGVSAGLAGAAVVRLFGTQITGNTTNGIFITGGSGAIVATHGNNAIFGNTGTQATNSTINTQ